MATRYHTTVPKQNERLFHFVEVFRFSTYQHWLLVLTRQFTLAVSSVTHGWCSTVAKKIGMKLLLWGQAAVLKIYARLRFTLYWIYQKRAGDSVRNFFKFADCWSMIALIRKPLCINCWSNSTRSNQALLF